MISVELQPDQRPEQWDDHVCVYEAVFEPFTLQFARAAMASLELLSGRAVLDVAAGCGGAAIAMREAGLQVTAIDASAGMVERIRARAAERGLAIQVQVMDGQALQFDAATFDAALSVLGIILLPNAACGLAEMRRVVRPGGRVAVVTWTQPHKYELAAELRAAIQSIWPEQPPAPLPAQLRYREEADFRALFTAAGLGDPAIATATAHLEVPSARWLAQRIGFAPGMAAMMAGLGAREPAVIERLIDNLETRLGRGPISLAGVAFIGTARVL
ncbi:MAG: methyltransferase domain-containing protein [Hyphomonadaceae bacterium]|jgi:SAM-dependent methyltransferase|nr:methyltransferase domain-containing protein [Hyphomonadaceae bacterium]